MRVSYLPGGRLTGLVLVLGLTSCGSMDPCSAAIIQEVPSPDQRWKAVVFNRSCGVLSSPQTGVSVLERPDSLGNHYPNVFNITAPAGLPPTDLRAVLDSVSVSWTSDSSMSIRFDGRATIFYQVVRLWGLVVNYECNRKEAKNTCR